MYAILVKFKKKYSFPDWRQIVDTIEVINMDDFNGELILTLSREKSEILISGFVDRYHAVDAVDVFGLDTEPNEKILTWRIVKLMLKI